MMIGSEISSDAQKLTMNDVMNGSATPKVTGFRRCSGSGLFSQLSRWPWKA